ncbi:calmodulin-like protein 5 [Rhodamnia argentea]|uniref:Calmodulin-like protein 5 n=1 Tax=Rhodamnia argentea TaxID=178133 RepID=A0ABM3GYK1_9MYRT|nr:calmodulin-like protein 5 [Rhodamnia argentea]
MKRDNFIGFMLHSSPSTQTRSTLKEIPMLLLMVVECDWQYEYKKPAQLLHTVTLCHSSNTAHKDQKHFAASTMASTYLREMSNEEFKKWLATFDANKDGRFSKEELRHAIRATGAWFPWLKTHNAVHAVDTNGDGFIDENEMNNLVDYAKKHLNVKIV